MEPMAADWSRPGPVRRPAADVVVPDAAGRTLKAMVDDTPRPPAPTTTTPTTIPVPSLPDGQEAPIDSALPSTTARLLAFAAIVISGICGGLIGWKVAELSISGDAGIIPGLAGLAGAIASAGGVAVVAVLVLRAMGEWATIVERASVAKEAEPSPPRSKRG